MYTALAPPADEVYPTRPAVYMFPVTPRPPETVNAPVELVVDAVASVKDVAPVTVPPVNEPLPPPAIVTVTAPLVLVAVTPDPVKFKLVRADVSVAPSSCTIIADPPPLPADPVYPMGPWTVLADPVKPTSPFDPLYPTTVLADPV